MWLFIPINTYNTATSLYSTLSDKLLCRYATIPVSILINHFIHFSSYIYTVFMRACWYNYLSGLHSLIDLPTQNLKSLSLSNNLIHLTLLLITYWSMVEYIQPEKIRTIQFQLKTYSSLIRTATSKSFTFVGMDLINGYFIRGELPKIVDRSRSQSLVCFNIDKMHCFIWIYLEVSFDMTDKCFQSSCLWNIDGMSMFFVNECDLFRSKWIHLKFSKKKRQLK